MTDKRAPPKKKKRRLTDGSDDHSHMRQLREEQIARVREHIDFGLAELEADLDGSKPRLRPRR